MRFCFLSLAAAATLSLASLPGLAQSADPTAWRASYSAAAVNVFASDLERGGSAGLAAFFAGVSAQKAIDAQWILLTGLGFNLLDFSFKNPLAFGGAAPWKQVYQPSVSLGVAYRFDDGWQLGLTPTLQYSGESAAKTGDALIWGALASASKTFAKDLRLGLGIGAFSRLEKNSVFPFLLVDWQLTDKLRLSNPFAAGPAGPAGLELAYQFGGGWEGALGAAYRSFRFRNSDTAPTPDSIGEAQMIPVFARVATRLTPTLQLELMGGATVANQLTLYDSAGNKLVREDQDPAPFLALTLSGSF